MSLIEVIKSQVEAALWECCSPTYVRSITAAGLIDEVLKVLCEDATAFATKDPASKGDPFRIVQAYTSFRAVLHYRVAHAMECNLADSDEGSCYALLVSSRGKLLSGAELHPRSRIGRRFVLDHGIGTVFGETVSVGDDCYVLGGVTLGASGIAGNPLGKRHPSIGNRVQLGAFSRIFGCVNIGDDVFIGPHCTINEDVLTGSKVILRSSLQIVKPLCTGVLLSVNNQRSNTVKAKKTMDFERKTNRLYYHDFFLREALTQVVRVEKDCIELNATVAYPEGGGQESDHGVIRLEDGTTLRFNGAKKIYTRLAGLKEFPGLHVDGVIQHMIIEEDRPLLNRIGQGMSAIVSIDVDRRARLALSHTASHLLYLGIGKIRPDAVESTIGCHIKTDGARFDFSIGTRFGADELLSIEEVANEYVRRNASISVSAHQQIPDARLWHCEEHVIPCGGIHIAQASAIGPLQVRRRGLGAGKERISCVFPQAQFQTDGYHT